MIIITYIRASDHCTRVVQAACSRITVNDHGHLVLDFNPNMHIEPRNVIEIKQGDPAV